MKYIHKGLRTSTLTVSKIHRLNSSPGKNWGVVLWQLSARWPEHWCELQLSRWCPLVTVQTFSSNKTSARW